METLTRRPYQDPQTSMERHIQTLVNDLRDGVFRRSEFAAKIEHAMNHAFWLEKRCAELSAENRKLEDALAVGLPRVSASWHDDLSTSQSIRTIEWRMEPIAWRSHLEPFQAKADPAWWKRIRRSTYRQLLKLIRGQFEKTFPTVPFV